MLHWVAVNQTDRWFGIRDNMVNPHGGRIATYGVATNPPGVDNAHWATIAAESVYGTGADIANVVKSILNGDPNMFVAVNELKVATVSKISDMANLMAGYDNRWGVYIVNGSGVSYSNLQPAIDNILKKNGRMLVELYPFYTDYWNGGSTDSARDSTLFNTFFKGTSLNRLEWLIHQRTVVNPPSSSRIHPIFTACDKWLNSSNETKRLRFMDRVLYVFSTGGTGQYRPLMLTSNGGGGGSYVWDVPAANGIGVSTTTRDEIVGSLFARYFSGSGATTPNWSGPMPAP